MEIIEYILISQNINGNLQNKDKNVYDKNGKNEILQRLTCHNTCSRNQNMWRS